MPRHARLNLSDSGAENRRRRGRVVAVYHTCIRSFSTPPHAACPSCPSADVRHAPLPERRRGARRDVSAEARALRRAAGEAQQEAEHSAAIARRLQDRVDKLRELERSMGKAEAAATHVVPPKPTLNLAEVIAKTANEFA